MRLSRFKFFQAEEQEKWGGSENWAIVVFCEINVTVGMKICMFCIMSCTEESGTEEFQSLSEVRNNG